MSQSNPRITVSTIINAPIERAWELWTKPEHITQWNFASDEWCCPTAENDLRPAGVLNWRMEARDGSMGFDFTGTYDEIKPMEFISYRITDGRSVTVQFQSEGVKTRVQEYFEADNTHPEDQQKAGWQAILDNFKNYAESASEKTN